MRGLPRPEDIVALPRQRFDACERRLGRALLANARAHHTRYARISSRLRPATVHQRVSLCRERLSTWEMRAGRALRGAIAGHRRHFEGCAKLMGSLSYQSVLQRGFVLVRDAGGRTVRRAHGLHFGDSLELEFHDGRVDAETRSVTLEATSETAAPQPPRDAASQVRRTGKRGGGQGSLF